MQKTQRTKQEAEQLLRAIINGCKSSDGSQLKCEVKEVSKIIYERYLNAEVGKLKLFKYSTGSQSNNKPYTYDTEVNPMKFNLIDICLVSLLQDAKNNDSIDDLLSKTLDDYEDSI